MKFWNITPFCPNKRLGVIHNEFVSLIPNDDYVIITDPDVMFLLPNQLALIEEIVLANPEYYLLGCMTNRVGILEQCYFGQIDGSANVTNHIRIAKQAYDLEGGNIIETDLIAGFLMVFKKSLWNKIKFQEGINFDIKFCESVKRRGGKIGIMKGIYVYHQYRAWSENPKTDKKHLLNK